MPEDLRKLCHGVTKDIKIRPVLTPKRMVRLVTNGELEQRKKPVNQVYLANGHQKVLMSVYVW